MAADGYVGLFSEPGRAPTDVEWVRRANRYLTAKLSALNAKFVEGSHPEQLLRMSYEPGPVHSNPPSSAVGLSLRCRIRRPRIAACWWPVVLARR